MKERVILSIDLKSFFASCECVYRGLDPFTTPLIVADTSRGKGAMSLAVTPYLRNFGIKSRSRLYEIPNNIKIMYVPPRMKLYESYSKKVIEIYKEFISEEDIHIYSIDEVFIDATEYLKLYNKTDIELAKMIMKTIKDKTGITSTCGIGPNIFLAKVAMDTEAKHNKDFISKWTYDDIEKKLWNISPLSEIWGFGKRTEKKLNNLNIFKVKDINKYKREFYIKRFGNVSGNDIWCKANGIDFTTIKELNQKSRNKSISMSQILYRNYNLEEALLIVREMNDMLNVQLKEKKLTTRLIHLSISYSRDLYKSTFSVFTSVKGNTYPSPSLPVIGSSTALVETLPNDKLICSSIPESSGEETRLSWLQPVSMAINPTKKTFLIILHQKMNLILTVTGCGYHPLPSFFPGEGRRLREGKW